VETMIGTAQRNRFLTESETCPTFGKVLAGYPAHSQAPLAPANYSLLLSIPELPNTTRQGRPFPRIFTLACSDTRVRCGLCWGSSPQDPPKSLIAAVGLDANVMAF